MSKEDGRAANEAEEQPVIEIHPPHEAAHSWRDILIHLATITVGLFIALSLEGCVEWAHHRHLVHEARENIRSEIEDNQKELKGALEQIHKEQAQVKQGIASLVILRHNPDAHDVSVTLSVVTSSLANASWNTAHETSALSYMTYPEVKKYAGVYDSQSEFGSLTARVLSAYTDSFSVLYIFDVDEKANQQKKSSDVDTALQKVLTVQSELMVYEKSAVGLDREYSEALKQSF